jgi:hypothetical protein
MKPSIAEILRRARTLLPIHQAAYLRWLIASEPRRSIRCVELEAALKDVISKQLRRENRQDKRRLVS